MILLNKGNRIKDMVNNRVKWKRLENVSKVFPPIANDLDTKVFRFSCQLKEKVDPSCLQEALNLTLESFPFYNSVIKRGFFWYYFEKVDDVAEVKKESQILYAPLYKDNKSLLYRVFYYNKRISLEVFHALTDGGGAAWFIETLISNYLRIKHHKDFKDDLPVIESRASIEEKMSDSFEKNYSSTKVRSKNKVLNINRPYLIKGTRNIQSRTKLIEATMPVSDVLSLAKSYNTSLTVYLIAVLIDSIHKDMPSKSLSKPVIISVPINLRQFYKSNTARNFYSTIEISYNFSQLSHKLEDIINYVSQSFKEKLSEENADKLLEQYMVIEKNPFARIIPLLVKDFALKTLNIYNNRAFTSSISNIGIIRLDEKFLPYVEKFAISISASRPQITLCSFNDKLVISFTSPFEETEIQGNFFRTIAKEGVEITITSNV